MTDIIARFLDKNEKLKVPVYNIVKAMTENNGQLTSSDFDDAFSRYTIKDCKHVRCRFLVFPPIYFVCANADRNHAYHLMVMQMLVSFGAVNKITVRDGLSIHSSAYIKYELLSEKELK
jgi:hypothetical protein